MRSRGELRETGVELAAITDADVAAVAEFLRDNHNDRAPWEVACAAPPWNTTAPNHGFLLRDGQRVVGTLLALYSERRVAGRVERFCNMGSWCVLPEYRAKSMALLRALLAQQDYHFTVLSPADGPREILAFSGFRFLDTSAALIPNLPWPTLPGRTWISADPDVIDATLSGTPLGLYRDHARTLAARHLVLTSGGESCYVMYRVFRFKGLPVFANVLYVSNRSVFRRALRPLTRYLLVHDGVVSTMVEKRLAGPGPRLSFSLANWPKMYRSASLDPESIDYLYSELTCVPW